MAPNDSIIQRFHDWFMCHTPTIRGVVSWRRQVAECEEEGKCYVRTLYNDRPMHIGVPQAPEWCPLEYFREVLKPLVPTEYGRECQCKGEESVLAVQEDGMSDTIGVRVPGRTEP
jgi:hypothetical protein